MRLAVKNFTGQIHRPSVMAIVVPKPDGCCVGAGCGGADFLQTDEGQQADDKK